MCSDREQKSTGKGYVLVFAPEHPARDIHGYVYEHRLMMEKHLGCPLAPGEVVHHRDKRRWNNSLDNLLLCPDQDIHLALHRAIDSHQDRLVAGYEKWLTATWRRGTSPQLNLLRLRRMFRAGSWPRRCECRLKNWFLHRLRRSLPSSSSATESRRSQTSLHIEEAGPPLLRILTSTMREHRRLAWSALAKRKYGSIDPQALGELAQAERGQPLLYAIGAIAKQCSPEQASPVLDQIESIEDPGYPRNRLQDALRRARSIARRRRV
jgi:hypothetical protein